MTKIVLTAAVLAALVLAPAGDAASPKKKDCAYPKVARQIDRMLAHVGSPAAGQGCVAAEEAIRHGWHPAFLIAVAGTESSFWGDPCYSNPKNGWGLANCDGRWHVPYFDTWREAFGFYARFLAGKTSVTSGWMGATTPYHFYGYAACTECWGAKTSQWMRWLGYSNSVKWPWR